MKPDKKLKYILDKGGRKTAVVMPIGKYEKLLEDLDDLKSIRRRRHEKTTTLAEVKKRLSKKYG